MPGTLPIRQRYEVTEIVLKIDAEKRIIAATKMRMQPDLLPAAPKGQISDRDRIELIKKAASAAAAIAKILASVEEEEGISAEQPPKRRVKITIKGRPVQPVQDLAVAQGDGSSVDSHGKQITIAVPENVKGMTRPRTSGK